MGMALLAPFTFFLEPVVGIGFLIGLYKGGTFGGALTAVLIGTPGTASNAASMLDGYPMAQRGEAGHALGLSLWGSVAGEDIVRDAFGEVHMLSHLVGTSNRLDLARLTRLEDALAQRDNMVARQQARLNDKAAELRRVQERLEEFEAEARSRPMVPAVQPPDDRERLATLRRADASEARCQRLERELAEAREGRRQADRALAAAEGREAELGRELAQADALLIGKAEADEDIDFRDATLLYVGGRPSQVEHLRELLLARGGVLLTHDGGVENSHSLLPGLVARADAVFFPVDCVSHAAMNVAKKHCRDLDKPLVPVRHASVTSFLVAAAAMTARSRELAPPRSL